MSIVDVVAGDNLTRTTLSGRFVVHADQERRESSGRDMRGAELHDGAGVCGCFGTARAVPQRCKIGETAHIAADRRD